MRGPLLPAGHRPAALLGMAAGFTSGVVLGSLAERAWVNWTFRHDPDRDEQFGGLHGESMSVRADDGARLYVEVETPRRFRPDEDLTIVFTHGYSLNQDCWHYQRRDLRDLGRLVFWDQRGHGRSGWTGSEQANIDQLGRDLAAVIEQVSPTGPVLVVGHSMGGMTVMALAAQRPELFGTRIVGAALLATSAGGIGTLSLGLPQAIAAVLHKNSAKAAEALVRQQVVLDRTRSRTSDLGILLTKTYSFGGWTSPSHTRFVAEMINATPIEVVAAFLSALESHDKIDALETIARVPVLVMVGTKDLMTPSSHSRRIIAEIPEADYVLLPDTGHMLISERYAEVNRRIRALVERAAERGDG